MSLPLESFPFLKTSDPDQAETILSRKLSDLRFRSVSNPRQFQFQMNGVHLGRTMIGFNRFATGTHVRSEVIQDAVILSINVGPLAALQIDGEPVGRDRLGITSPTTRADIRREAGSGIFLLRTSMTALEDRYRELTGTETNGPLRFDRSVPLNHGVGRHIHELVNWLAGDDQRTTDYLQNPLLQAGADDMLLNAFLALPHNHSDALHADRIQPTSRQIVARAEEFLQACAGEPITISHVVAECECSRRALFAAFRRHRSHTPMEFLAEVRLQTARMALRNAAPAETVTSIAMACGFSHMGRFSGMYRRRFGETPSQTLRHEQ